MRVVPNVLAVGSKISQRASISAGLTLPCSSLESKSATCSSCSWTEADSIPRSSRCMGCLVCVGPSSCYHIDRATRLGDWGELPPALDGREPVEASLELALTGALRRSWRRAQPRTAAAAARTGRCSAQGVSTSAERTAWSPKKSFERPGIRVQGVVWKPGTAAGWLAGRSRPWPA